MAPSGYRYLSFISSMFVATLLISNIAAQKLIPFGPFVFTGGVILFPITYIFGDVLTEVYGYAKARQAIWAGFIANIAMALFIQLVIYLPPAPGWDLQREFAAALSSVPRVVLGSILAFWAGEFVNSYVLAKLKLATSGRYLWVRTVSSTIAGQAVDTVVFLVIAFAGVLPASLLLQAAWSGYLFKVIYEAMATPLTYLLVNWLKRGEGVDAFDKRTNFSPFSFSLESANDEHSNC